MDAALVCLASLSPRRAELLGQIGVPYSIAASNIDERAVPGEAAADYVVRLARAKALAVKSKQHLPVLGADTTVVVDDLMLGKPRDAAESLLMLRQLSGRSHRVLTAVA